MTARILKDRIPGIKGIVVAQAQDVDLLDFGPHIYPTGSLVITLVCPVTLFLSIFNYLRDCSLVGVGYNG